MYIIYSVIVLMNILGFCLMKRDKNRALKHKARISEVTFMAVSLLGGFMGIIAGGYMFRHKTKKRSFQIKVGLAFLASVVLYANVLNIIK
ncbi:MAG: DUF1294 domain-containing protein [Erysipelothrix sp.]